MPITLGCPSCGKRFRARDESAGKRVKCPYCQAAVPVPSPEEAHNAAAPTDVVAAPSGSAPGAGSGPVAPAAGWTEEPAGAAPAPSAPVFPPPSQPRSGAVPAAPAVAKKADEKPAKAERVARTPAELAAPRWRRARRGMWWVLFGLFWFALIGFIPFGVAAYERSSGPLPDERGWVTIEGYVNDPNTPGSVEVSKREEILLAAFGVPLLIGGLALTLGRLTCAAVPRSSGAKGMFLLSGLLSLAAVVAFFGSIAAGGWGFVDVFRLAAAGWVVVSLVAESLFLLGLAVCGASLRRPRAARAAGFVVLVAGVFAGLAVAGTANEWEVLHVTKRQFRAFALPESGPPAGEFVLPPGVQDIFKKGGGKGGQKGGGKGGGKGGPKGGAKGPEGVGKAPEGVLPGLIMLQPQPPAVQPLPKNEAAKGAEPPRRDESAKKEETSKEARPDEYSIVLRHHKLDMETRLGVTAGGMLAWLLLIGVYWRAVGAARWAITDSLAQAEEKAA